MRADGVLGDEQPLGDLVRAVMVVEQEEHLHLAGREERGDAVRDAAAPAGAVPHLLEEATRDRPRQCSLATRDPVEEGRDPFRRLRLQKVAGRARADRREQVLLGAGRREDDDLAVGCGLAEAR